MKKYLFILCVAATLLTACDELFSPTSNTTVHFGTSHVSVSGSEATITIETPYLMVDGIRTDAPAFYVGYMELGESNITMVKQYKTKNNKAIFEIKDLTPDMDYEAYVFANDGTKDVKCEEPIYFNTEPYAPMVDLSCDVSCDAKGLYATVFISELEYLLDDEPQDIELVTLKYKHVDDGKWRKIKISGEEIEDGELTVRIPESTEEYLEENSEYEAMIVLTPEDDDLDDIESENFLFETTNAKITANITTPQARLDGENVTIKVSSVEVLYDGLAANLQKCEYFIYLRDGGDKEWTNMYPTTLEKGGLSIIIPATQFILDKEYETCGAVVIGKKGTKTSKICTFKLSTEEEGDGSDDGGGSGGGSDDGGSDDGGSDDGGSDDGGSDDGGSGGGDDKPELPTPPAGGSSDTSAIAGEWHLDMWRNATPSFDVYLSITDDGVVSLWQRIQQRQWELFYSTVDYDGEVIYGEYDDGSWWASAYYVSIDGDRMTWTDTKDDTDISVYVRTTIPEDVTLTRSSSSGAGSRFL